MRSDNRLPALLLAAVLGTALIGCQRQETPSMDRGTRLPLIHGERFGAPPMGAETPAGPGTGQGLPPNHPPIRKPALIVA
jgi:hypothetical protein